MLTRGKRPLSPLKRIRFLVGPEEEGFEVRSEDFYNASKTLRRELFNKEGSAIETVTWDDVPLSIFKAFEYYLRWGVYVVPALEDDGASVSSRTLSVGDEEDSELEDSDPEDSDYENGESEESEDDEISDPDEDENEEEDGSELGGEVDSAAMAPMCGVFPSLHYTGPPAPSETVPSSLRPTSSPTYQSPFGSVFPPIPFGLILRRPGIYASGELPVSGRIGNHANHSTTGALSLPRNSAWGHPGFVPPPMQHPAGLTRLFDSPTSPLRLESRQPESSHYPRLRTAQSQERREEPSVPDAPPVFQELHIKSGEELCDLLDRIKKPRWEVKARFMAHTKLYLLAVRYLVTDLEEVCLDRIWEELHHNLHREEVFEALIQMVKIAYSGTEEEYEERFELQHLLSLACADNLNWLEGDDQRVMRRVNMFKRNEAFAKDVHEQMEECHESDRLVEKFLLQCWSI
ncbi:hypothetical protein CSOJ01_11018 [Colletotrichum sojae]|uniref:BTB domain-containing protein n=1 Tax=Colletotrichum sojae TaxID=2175907 RepID=A0A8H6IZA9_9PEZI|nr:hypothetical protein CSOJ01_11018 [Colletotrichum sojae]